MPNLDGLDRRLQKLEQRQSLKSFAWRLKSGRQVSFDAIQMYAAYMDLCGLIYAAWLGEELGPPSGALAALLESSAEERVRLAQSLSWLNSFDAMVERWQNPTPEDVAFALQDEGGGEGDVILGRFP